MNNERIESNALLIKNARLINDLKIIDADILIIKDRIQEIAKDIVFPNAQVLDMKNKYVMPGIIDAQVHFREPGLTNKADILSESQAAAAGGITSFIDMPNTLPFCLTKEELKKKYVLGSQNSVVNYGFVMGVSDSNIGHVPSFDFPGLLALSDDGLYLFENGNSLVENPSLLRKLFESTGHLVCLHAEWHEIVKKNEAIYSEMYGPDNIPFSAHPKIRNDRLCFDATKAAIKLATDHNARLHIYHLTSGMETSLFENNKSIREKRITTEVCVQHLWFCDNDYQRLGPLIKWNPSIKSEFDRQALWEALLDDRIDIITSDHAPHELHEKKRPYLQSLSGAPIIQHALHMMFEFYFSGTISLEKIVEKMCHNPALLYGIADRGFLREGYFADLTIVDPNAPWTVSGSNILSKCGWSPLDGHVFTARVTDTLVNGQWVYSNGRLTGIRAGNPLLRSFS